MWPFTQRKSKAIGQAAVDAVRPEYKWPDCSPPMSGCIFSAVNFGDGQYKKAEVAPGKWQWVTDDEANRSIARHNAERRSLFWALRTRVLSDDELALARQYGDCLNIESGVSYRAEEKSRELNDAYYQQARLRSLQTK